MQQLNNTDMKPCRYLRWHSYRKMIANIRATLASDGVVMIPTYTRCTRYDRRHIDMFKANRNGAWVQRGKSWDCISLSKIIHCRRLTA
jgi:hypothetical protein